MCNVSAGCLEKVNTLCCFDRNGVINWFWGQACSFWNRSPFVRKRGGSRSKRTRCKKTHRESQVIFPFERAEPRFQFLNFSKNSRTNFPRIGTLDDEYTFYVSAEDVIRLTDYSYCWFCRPMDVPLVQLSFCLRGHHFQLPKRIGSTKKSRYGGLFFLSQLNVEINWLFSLSYRFNLACLQAAGKRRLVRRKHLMQLKSLIVSKRSKTDPPRMSHF